MGSNKRQPLKNAVWSLPPSLSIFSSAAQMTPDTADKTETFILFDAFKPLENILTQAGLFSKQEITQEKVQRQHYAVPTGKQAERFHQVAAQSQKAMLKYDAHIMTVPSVGVYVVALSLNPDMIYVMPIEKKHDEDRNWLKKLASGIYLHDFDKGPTHHKPLSTSATKKIQSGQSFNIALDSSLWEAPLLSALTAKSGQAPAKNTAPAIS